MVENAEQIVDGIVLAMKASGVSCAKVGIEDNKPDAIAAMREAASDKQNVEVVSLPARYPQGFEKTLIYSLTGRIVPNGKLPSAAKCVVMNVGTCAALSAAVRKGQPLIDRVVTVTGRVAKPTNFRVRIGTPLLDLSLIHIFDFAFSKASLAKQMDGCMPKMNREGRLNIVQGRHPLIDPQKVVPLDIRLGNDFTTLIITGPNTGGKTVTLKTTGLFTLMAQSGLQVPAEYGTELAVFDDVFADIGDEQSIEQSLSTFSGHMTNIVSILQNVTPESLVLFDELGAGTDPTEGAALAQAVLSTLLDMHTRTVATTHYSELKEYALTTPNVENASVEFDVATLRPTYRLSIGIPGKSNAFEISRKLGLPEFIIGRAKELLSKEQVRFEDVIANAEYHRQVAKKERELAEQARNEMISIRDQAEAEKKKLEDQREKSIRKAKDEAKRIVENAKRESEAMIAELRAMKKAGGAQEHEIQKVKKQMEKAQEALADQKEVGGEVPKSVKPGDMVHIASMDVDAIIVAPVDSKGYVQLKVGMMKMRAPLSDLRTLTATQQMVKKEQKKLERKKSMREARVDITTRAVRQELDARGMALDEAIPEVEKFIDDAMLSSLGEVSIIHGNGTGVLRAGIQDCLRRHPCVSSFRLGRYGEGETGVTIVSLK